MFYVFNVLYFVHSRDCDKSVMTVIFSILNVIGYILTVILCILTVILCILTVMRRPMTVILTGLRELTSIATLFQVHTMDIGCTF